MDKIVLTFAGDILIKSLKDISLSAEIENLFKTSDLVVGNLEGAETSGFQKTDKAGPSLKQDRGTIKWLSKIGVNCLGLANNHIFDYGIEGLHQTIKICNQVGIRVSGGGRDTEEALIPIRVKINNKNLSIFSLAEKEFGYLNDNSQNWGYATLENQFVDQVISREKNLGRFVIVLVHGGSEECPIPGKFSRKRYKELILRGADIVVGSHPHVPQGYEKFDGKYIYYSLGDFTLGFSGVTEGRWGLLLQVEIGEKDKYSCKLNPIIMQENQIQLMGKKDYLRCLNFLKKLSSVYNERQLFEKAYFNQINYLFKTRYAHFLNQLFFKSPPLIWYLKFQQNPYINQASLKLSKSQKLLMQLMFTNETHRENISEYLTLDEEDNYRDQSKIFEYYLNGVNDFSKA